jgi:hypothetical protein
MKTVMMGLQSSSLMWSKKKRLKMRMMMVRRVSLSCVMKFNLSKVSRLMVEVMRWR